VSPPVETSHLVRRKLSTRLDDRLETLLHAISLFLHRFFLNIRPDLLDFALERRNRPGFASLQFLLHVSPHLFNRIQVWRVGRPLSMRAGFDVIWDVCSSHSFVIRACGDAPSCTNVQLRLPEPNILSKSGFAFFRSARYLGPVRSSL